jgi:hypothetical protein
MRVVLDPGDVIAVIDVGSNSVRLLLVRELSAVAFEVIDEERFDARLGQGQRNGMLTEAAMERGLQAIRVAHEIAAAMEPAAIVVAGTEALRRAPNAQEFIDGVREQTGLTVRVLSTAEEGYASVLGAINSTGMRDGYMVDIGGGSLEVMRVADGVLAEGQSAPLGAIYSTERYLGGDPPTSKELRALRKAVREQIRVQPGPGTLIGIGGAVRNLARIERLKRKFGVEVELTLPRVPYRETVAKKGSGDYTHKKQTGGHGQYARVVIELNPLPRGSGLQFTEKVVGGAVPKEFIPAVEKGIMEAATAGVFAGYELTDCQVVLFDGKHHPVDSSEMAFKLAASQALKEAVAAAGPQLLEPVMTIRVQAPELNAGDIVSDLNTKRAKIHGINPDGGMSVIEAEVPLAEVQRYASDLRSITQGRGGFELEFDHYGEVPGQIAQRVAAEHKKAIEEAHH